MNKIIIVLVVLTLTWTLGMATDHNNKKSVFISGKITTNTDSLRLMVGYWPHYITGVGKEFSVKYVPVNSDGTFQLQLPATDQPFRLQLADGLSSNMLFDNSQLAEPGDSVFVSATLKDQEQYSEENFVGTFSGRGAAKYNCNQQLKLISDDPLRNNQFTTQQRIGIADSLRIVKEAILNRYKPELNQAIYQIIKADILGTLQFTFLVVEQTRNGGNITFRMSDLFAAPDIPDSILAMSEGYTNYLYARIKHELRSSGSKASLSNLYYKIRSAHSGMLREKLLARCLLSDMDVMEGFNDDTETYTLCLEDAVALIQTPWIRDPVETLLKTRGKGALAFNFTLPLDTTAKALSLSSLKGKVVLLDCWSYICTGCYRFANAFHQKVYPKFRNDPDFKVVSIMLDRFSDKEKYRQRLRGENGPIYTFEDYINLYGGKGEAVGRAMEQHYNIQSYPFILLIDKQGKIFSSTIPFIDSPDSPNVEKLIELIKKALAQS